MMNLNKVPYRKIKEFYIPISVIYQKTGLSQNVIYASLSENGKRKLRTNKQLKICIFLKITPCDLYEGQD